VTLSWTAVGGATSYSLFRAAESGHESTASFVTGIHDTSYAETGLNAGTTYYYQVVAVNSNGASGFSPETSATTPESTQTRAIHFENRPQGWSFGGVPSPAWRLPPHNTLRATRRWP